jgi:hypothetical protein
MPLFATAAAVGPEGYKNFDAGVTNKFVINPHGQLPKAACPVPPYMREARSRHDRKW